MGAADWLKFEMVCGGRLEDPEVVFLQVGDELPSLVVTSTSS